jgi:hypothetical protein
MNLPEPYDHKLIDLFRAIFHNQEVDQKLLQDSKELFKHCCDSRYKDHVVLIYRAYPFVGHHVAPGSKNHRFGSLLLEMMVRHPLQGMNNSR